MISDAAYQMLTGEDDGRVCKDIPESACHHQPRNFFIHVLSLGATKTGDGLIDPKLILSWLLGALGAPAVTIGLLVPIREAGALLPQLFTAAAIRSLPRRKWIWTAGSVTQGVSAAAMALAALSLDGAQAGWTIVGLLAVFAIGRSVCSVSYKDVLGKTVSKSTRGTATGTATTIGAACVLGFGMFLSIGPVELGVGLIAAALVTGGSLWIVAALLFATLHEEPGATDGGGNPISVIRSQFGLLREDPQLVRFILTRGLLIATALAPPYMLALAGRDAAETGSAVPGALGPFVIAAALAAVFSSYVWGRLSDSSSRRVLALSAAVATVALAATVVYSISGRDTLSPGIALPALLFVLMVSYQGVRLGRSTHLVDMADADVRAAYTALSNSIVGLLLVAGGLFGLIAQWAGETTVIVIFAVMSAAAIAAALGLKEVQQSG